MASLARPLYLCDPMKPVIYFLIDVLVELEIFLCAGKLS